MSLLSLILKEKDPNGNVRQLCGSDLSKISESELEEDSSIESIIFPQIVEIEDAEI